MDLKREDVNKPSHWPEPWDYDGEYLRDCAGLPIAGGPAWDAACLSELNGARIVAAINFCRNLRTEFLEQHTLTNIENMPFVAGMFLLEKEGGAE